MGALVTNPVLIFFIVLMIILLAPLLLHRLRIPHVVGLIVAGVIVGPYGFNILERDSSFEIFGKVGLLYLMFLAGLEIDMFHLRLNMRKGLIFGLITFILPLIMGAIASMWLLHMNLLTSLLLASMYASHTLIAYPITTRFGINKSPAVLISIVGTIVAVFGALLILAMAVEINQTGEFAWWQLLKMLGCTGAFAGAVIWTFPRITRWFFKRYNDKVSQYVYVLAMTFLSAGVAQLLGLEAVLGAFLAGLVLNRYVPSVSPLMSRIEFVGNALFIPYFLIGVGMMINVRVISNPDTLIVAGNMLVIAIVGKWLAALVTQKAYKMQVCDRNVMFGLTTAHTAVALAVVTIGYDMILPDGTRMMDETVLNGTVLMILVTCAMAPIITSRAAAKVKLRMLVQEKRNPEGERMHSMRTLVTVANPVTTPGLVDLAMMMKRHTTDDSIMALHVRNANNPTSRVSGENVLNLAGDAAASMSVQMRAMDRFDMNTVAGIANFVKEFEVTDIIMGMHLHGNIGNSIFGDTITGLLSRLNKMIIINRCFIPLNTITRIVVAVPAKAEFETGFESWVIRVAALTSRIGCRARFYCPASTRPLIEKVLMRERIGIRTEFEEFDDWNDFALLANQINEDDLLMVVSARANSLSHSGAIDDAITLLARHYGHTNMVFIFPEQFNANPMHVTFNDPLKRF